jgi:hypothetical protein
MKAIAQKRARIARVRHVQHMQAAAAVAAAEGHVLQLETSAARLATLRGSLSVMPGASSGAALNNAGELAMRLDSVREGLTGAITNARVIVDQRAEARLEARRRQESADKLDARAATALARWLDRNMPAGRQRRPALSIVGGDK